MANKKYKNLKTVGITLEQSVLDFLDEMKGSKSRGQFIKDLLNSKGSGTAVIEAQKKQIQALEAELTRLTSTV